MVVRTLVKRRDRPRRCRQGLASTGSKVLSPRPRCTPFGRRLLYAARASPPGTTPKHFPLVRGSKGVVPLARFLVRGSKGVVPLARILCAGVQGPSPLRQTKPPVTPASLAFPCERAGVCGGFVFGTLAVVRPVVNRGFRPPCPPHVDNRVDSMCTWLGRVVERPQATAGTPLVHLVETCSTGGMPNFSKALA
jgi:hypothetical protein